MAATRAPLAIAQSIGDRLVGWQAASGGTDPEKCPLVPKGAHSGKGRLLYPQMMAGALYCLFDRTGESRYKESADRYAIFSFCYPRDPVPPVEDRQRNQYLARLVETSPQRQVDPRVANNWWSRAATYGMALDPAYTGFRRHNAEEDCFDARADALFDWLQLHRTDRGHAYNIGYVPSNCADPTITDGAFTDDLRMVGRGLVGYYELTQRQDVLESALRLSDYYLRAHKPGSPDGAFVESLGTWCIGPWPVTIAAEHFPSIRMDQAGWGFTARGAVEFLTRLHALLPLDHFRVDLMRDRCTRSVQWQFSCQFDDGAVGMQTQDDKWLGMTAAALLAYADIDQAGWVDGPLTRVLRPKVTEASRWLVENATEEFIDEGGYRRVTGKTAPHPARNLVWLLAVTVEALLRIDQVYL